MELVRAETMKERSVCESGATLASDGWKAASPMSGKRTFMPVRYCGSRQISRHHGRLGQVHGNVMPKLAVITVNHQTYHHWRCAIPWHIETPFHDGTSYRLSKRCGIVPKLNVNRLSTDHRQF